MKILYSLKYFLKYYIYIIFLYFKISYTIKQYFIHNLISA